MNEVWTHWEGEVINGTFPLRRLLGASDHSGVFLTEHPAQNLPKAAIKVIPADPGTAQIQLSRWSTAAALSHPHLIRLLDSGRCQLGDDPFLFLVMEYAGETLSEILPSRALTEGEVRELLIPTLDVLTFLHSKSLVQGHLQPSNILVVDDQPKLASDSIGPVGEFTPGIARPSPYDAPEKTKNGEISAAADIWALGVTLIEALTQRPSTGPIESSGILSWPASLPPAFVDTVRRCLSRNPADRPTASELQTQAKEAAPAILVPNSQPVVRKTTGRVTPPEKSSMRRLSVQAVGVIIFVLIALWAGWHLIRSNPHAQQDTSSTSQSSLQPAVSPDPSSSTNPTESKSATPRAVSDASFVVHEEIPDVPQSANQTIHGHIDVSVLVTVDSSGNVVDEIIKKSGPSQYFARAATAAAKRWKFAPAANQDPREWLLWFQFTSSGATAHATIPRS